MRAWPLLPLQVLGLMKKETETTLALMGLDRLAAVDGSALQR